MADAKSGQRGRTHRADAAEQAGSSRRFFPFEIRNLKSVRLAVCAIIGAWVCCVLLSPSSRRMSPHLLLPTRDHGQWQGSICQQCYRLPHVARSQDETGSHE